jgi:hypothetical protein
MADVASIVVRIITEKKGDAGKELEGTAAKVDGVSKKFSKFVLPAAAAAAAVVAFGKSAADSASRTEQAMGGLDAVFGKNSGKVKKWAGDAATSVGLAKSEYAEFAALIGAQLKNAGIPMDQVTNKTKDLIGLGADLAATYGGTTADAVSALTSALKGEFDPMDKYGTKLSAAGIAAQQAAEGTDKLEGSAAAQAKTMATLNLITKQTGDAQGQFAKQSGTAAEQAQMASAGYENMKSSLGTALLPVVVAISKALGAMAGFIGEHPKLAQAAAAAILVLASVIIVLAGAVKIYNLYTAISAIVTQAAWLSAIWPILAVVAAIALVIGIIVILWKKSETFRAVVTGVWNAIKAVALATWNAILAAGAALWNLLKVYVSAWAALTRAAFNSVLAVGNAVWNAIKAAVGGVSSAVSGLIGWLGRIRVPGAVVSAFDAIKAAVGRVVSAIESLIGWIGRIKLPGSFGSAFDTLAGAIGNVIGKIQSLIGWLGRIKVPKIHIPGVGKAAPAAVPGVARLGATPAVTGVSRGITAAAAPTGAPGVTIVVNGALDPDAVARQIRRLLTAHGQRTGTPVLS